MENVSPVPYTPNPPQVLPTNPRELAAALMDQLCRLLGTLFQELKNGMPPSSTLLEEIKSDVQQLSGLKAYLTPQSAGIVLSGHKLPV